MNILEIAERALKRQDDPPSKLPEDYYKQYFGGPSVSESQPTMEIWDEKMKPIDPSSLPRIQYLSEIFKEDQLRIKSEPQKTSLDDLIGRYTTDEQLAKLDALRAKNRSTSSPADKEG